MNRQRFTTVMILVALGLMGLALYTQKNAQQEPASNAPGGAPASQAATTSAPATAESAPATMPAQTSAPSLTTTQAVATSASQPTDKRPGGDKWTYFGDNKARKVSFGSLDPKDGFAFGLDLVNQGAAIYTAKLTNYYTTVEDKTAAAAAGADHQKYLDKVGTEGLQGHYSLLNPVPRDINRGALTAHDLDEAYRRYEPAAFAQNMYLPMATRWVKLEYENGDTVNIYVEAMRWVGEEVKNPPAGQRQFVFKLTLVEPSWRGAKERPYIELTKTYTITKGAQPGENFKYDQRPYSIRVELSARNLTSDKYKVKIDQGGATGVPRDDVRQDFRRLVWARLDAEGKIQPQRRPATDKEMPSSEREWLGKTSDKDPLIWMGQTNKFFSSILYLCNKSADVIVPTRTASWYYEKLPETVTNGKTNNTVYTGLQLEMSLEPASAKGDSDTAELDFFAGPKLTELFHETPMYNKLDYAGTIELGASCCGMTFCSFDWLSKLIMSFLEVLARYVTFGNYGVGIIVLVVIVRVCLHPLTKKSQISMSKMQKLAPRMKEIQEKYKNDKDTLNREMLKQSKEQAGVFLGCLPMLLQLPIWIALYSGLQADASLRHAAFLPFWITDLAGQDAIFRWSTPIEIPLIGGLMGPIVSLNLLPILLTVAMYFQAKLTPTPSTAMTPEQEAQQKMQQRMMRIMTPVMMLLFFYNAPAGLTLYIMTSTASGVIEQMVIRKHIRERDEALAAGQTEIVVPGKFSRDNRPKKPKGPFWTKRG